MWKPVVAIALLVGICWSTASCGSDESVCEEAGAKVLSCIKSLDCTTYDGMERSMCEAFQNPQATTTQEDGKCEGATKEEAQKLLDCELDKEQLCSACIAGGG